MANLLRSPATSPSMQATISICTFNGSKRLPSLFQALGRQEVPGMDWEVLVVDNASNDGTGERALELVGRLPGCRGRVIREETLGLSFARRRAAVEAKGEIICFLDDDNIPDENFVA